MENKYIINKLDTFLNTGKIPHLLFYGSDGTGKRCVLDYLINKIYKDVDNKNEYIIKINCCLFKGIKYIRDDLKFFGKKQIINYNNKLFKTVILYNADSLTIDAQSSLRRLIEIYSKNTRFFMITSNKNKIIRPILSRLCIIYFHDILIKNKYINLHKVKNNSIINKEYYINQDKKIIKTKLDKFNELSNEELIILAKDFYNKCITIEEIIEYFKKYYNKENSVEINKKILNIQFKIKYLMKEIKNDLILIYFTLLFFRFNYDFRI